MLHEQAERIEAALVGVRLRLNRRVYRLDAWANKHSFSLMAFVLALGSGMAAYLFRANLCIAVMLGAFALIVAALGWIGDAGDDTPVAHRNGASRK